MLHYPVPNGYRYIGLTAYEIDVQSRVVGESLEIENLKLLSNHSQACGSAFIFCGSGSSSFSRCGSGSSCFLNGDPDPAYKFLVILTLLCEECSVVENIQ